MLNSHEQQILNSIERNLLETQVTEEVYGTISLKLENHLRKNNFVITNEMPKAKIRRILKFKYKDLIAFLKDLSNQGDIREWGMSCKDEIQEITSAGNECLDKIEAFIKNADENWLKEELEKEKLINKIRDRTGNWQLCSGLRDKTYEEVLKTWIYVNILDTIFFVFYEYFFSNSIGLKYPNLL